MYNDPLSIGEALYDLPWSTTSDVWPFSEHSKLHTTLKDTLVLDLLTRLAH